MIAHKSVLFITLLSSNSCVAIIFSGVYGMDWISIKKRFKTGQRVSAQIESVDHAGIVSLVDDIARGYTKRSEAVLTRKTIDLRETFEPGQVVQAVVIGFNKKYESLELSFKQAEKNPWPDFIKNDVLGKSFVGQVVMLTESKAFVEFKPGILGVIHKNDAWLQADNIEHVFMVDDIVCLHIQDIDHENQILVLTARTLFADERDDDASCATFKIEEKLNEALQIFKWQETRQTQQKYSISEQFKKRFSNVYILDTHDELVQPMQNMLSGYGIDTKFVVWSDSLEIQEQNSLMLVSSSEADEGFLPLLAFQKFPQLPLLVYGKSEQFELHRDKLVLLDNKTSFIRVPHSTKQLVNTLNIIADDDTVNALKYHMSHPRRETEETTTILPSYNSIDSVLNEIKTQSGAKSVIIFQINLNSMETNIYACTGESITVSSFDHGHLQFTPISDVIVDGELVRENRSCNNFKYMKPLGKFESFVGIKINYADDFGYGLFLFGDDAASFHNLSNTALVFCEMAVRAQLERKKLVERTSEEQKFVLSGRLTSNFMHEMKNQIQALDYWLDILKSDSIRLNTGALKANDKLFLARFEQAIDGSRHSEKRMRDIEELFLNLFRNNEKRSVSLKKYIEDFAETMSPIAKKERIRIRTDLANIELKTSVSSLNQILINLLLNSIDFVPLVRKRSGLIHINSYIIKEDDCPVKIEINDNGPGINNRNCERVFDLLYTTKKNGSGLWLAISRRLAESLGGRLTIKETQRLSGVTFLLELPLK
jgi:signal transduction histidine kinase/predicted RNA-binding protein with RPS1 domain